MTAARPILELIAAGDHRVMRRVHRWPAPAWVRLWMVAATPRRRGRRARHRDLSQSEEADRTQAAPCAIEPHCWATLLPPDQFSFPSGHSITAFSAAVSLGHFYTALFAGLLLCAASVAISRVLLGMHFLSDVIAGSALGTALALAAVRLIG